MAQHGKSGRSFWWARGTRRNSPELLVASSGSSMAQLHMPDFCKTSLYPYNKIKSFYLIKCVCLYNLYPQNLKQNDST